jgi:mRNA-degrading endonuclease RelE of RelBE toxin-antitoxin system
VYKVEFSPQAEKDLLSIEKSVAIRVADKITFLSENAGQIVPEPLRENIS